VRKFGDRMRISFLAKKYSRALFNSLAENQREGALASLKALQQTLFRFAELRMVLLSPVVKSDDKMSVINVMFERLKGEEKKDPPATLKNFFKVLIELSRVELFEEIVASYEAEFLASTGVTFLRVETARGLSEEELGKLNELLSRSFGKKLKVQLSENRAIIGGLRIWKDDELIDASVISQLHQVRESLIVQ
jgi:F-type H+-transporting ATPase subunit delta